jgi:hypothetical protein
MLTRRTLSNKTVKLAFFSSPLSTQNIKVVKFILFLEFCIQRPACQIKRAAYLRRDLRRHRSEEPLNSAAKKDMN